MARPKHDPGLDDLLALDGVTLVVDPVGNLWVKFVAHRVEPTPERPHGISYSLTLHAADGERILTVRVHGPALRQLRVSVRIHGRWRRLHRSRIQLPASRGVVSVRATGIDRSGGRRLATVAIGS